LPFGNKHCFVNHDFGLPKTNESRLNSIEVWERNWAKAACRDCQATSVTNNHKNIILDRSGKTKLGQRVRTGDDQTFIRFRICGTRSGSSGKWFIPRATAAMLLENQPNQLIRDVAYSFCTTVLFA
jgi:hypothetical protein